MRPRAEDVDIVSEALHESSKAYPPFSPTEREGKSSELRRIQLVKAAGAARNRQQRNAVKVNFLTTGHHS